MQKQIFLLLIVCFLSITVLNWASAQPQALSSDYVSHIWTASDGLPGNAVTDIMQETDGYLYIGTYDGLVKFDGIDFKVLNKSSGTEYSFVSARSVLEDSGGSLWIGANDEGVEKISPDGKTRIYTTATGLPNNSIRAFAEDGSKNVWIGTASGVVYVSPDGQVHTPAGFAQYDNGKLLVIALYCDSAGRIWIVSSNMRGLYYYTDGEFHRYTALDSFGNFYATAIGQNASHAFWFGLGAQGAVLVDNEKITAVKSGTVLDSSPANCIYCDKNGIMWFGTENGLVQFTDGVYYQYTETNGLSNNNVKRIIEDREGDIWLATDRGEIEKLNHGKFQMNSIGETVNAIAEDKTRHIWIGTDNGLRCYYYDKLEENELTKLCEGQRIRHIGITKDGDILVSCYAKPGQVRYTASTNRIRSWTTDSGLTGNKTRVAVEKSNKDIYVGTTTGLSIIHPDGKIDNYLRQQGLSSDYIMCIYEDTDGVMWIGTDGGGIDLLKDGKVVETITTENGLAGNVIFKIMQDRSGVFWICTGTGISYYDRKNSKSICNFTSATGIGSDSVFQLLFDYTGTVWMTSNRGISSAPVSDFKAVAAREQSKVDVKFFNQNDGLRSGGVTSTSLGMCDSFGRIWFTLIDGFAVYDPVKAKSNSVPPIIHIESAKLDDREIQNINKPIVIPAGVKRIEIKYTGLSYTSPGRIRFKYQLVGFEDKYSEPVSNRIVSYTNLKPGKYRFSVMATNGDGVWSNTTQSLLLRQQAYFYQQVWFWIVCVLILGGAIVALFRIRDADNKKRQLQLETTVQMKTVDLEIERDRSEKLLLNILPKSVAEKLKKPDSQTIADRYEETTVLFSDIVGFTDITAHETPEAIVTALNSLITLFDERAKNEGVEKIKTIGDAYMAACGVPTPNPDHAAVMLRFAEGMYRDLAEYNRSAEIRFSMRIGVNSGPVVAGVIGKEKFIYDLWGDTVNVASRMQALCTPGEILATEEVRKRVEKTSKTISFADATEYDVKGKGIMKTYTVWV
jgi:ligand-binding sensor domain-containing protein/class 3 adenylate cyclase